MRKTFPFHGWIGILLLIAAEFFHFKRIDPFYSWFYCFAWWSYILTIDALIHRLKGNSLISKRRKEFLMMIGWSVVFWLIFEAANLSLKNWYYINIPPSPLERWLGYAVAYGTVLPGLFETTELLESVGLFRNSTTRGISLGPPVRLFLMLLGLLSLLLSLLVPLYFFPLIWVGFTLLLDPINDWMGGRSFLRDLEAGNPKKIYLLLLAGLICGLLWEFWNYWSKAKWVYTVPFFEKEKGFEMPFLGFLGFPPFAVQVYVMYNTLSLFRFGRGWEQDTYRLNPGKRTPPRRVVLGALLALTFSIVTCRAIDTHTVDSYEPRLSEAYWIPPEYRSELPRIGIATLDDLISKTEDRRERDDLALRLLVPKEELQSWLERARLARLKGLGLKNLRLLEGINIHSVSALAKHDPARLQEALRQAYASTAPPSVAKLRIWIREAQKVNGNEARL